MFGRRDRKTPFERDPDERLEDLRDDCIALFLNSGLTQKELQARGGPTPQTTSKWLYKETRFPRLQTVMAVANALGRELAIVDPQDPAVVASRTKRLNLSKRPVTSMPAKSQRKAP